VHDASTIALFVVLLVMGILAVNLMVWIPIIIWWRRKSRAIQAQLAATIQSEGVIRPPEKAAYRGATAPGFPVVKNNGVIALTMRRVIFVTLTGRSVEVPLTAITGVRESKVFKASVAGGHVHLLLQTASGEVGFFVADNAAWIDSINKARV
jgi:hypothetical protein